MLVNRYSCFAGIQSDTILCTFTAVQFLKIYFLINLVRNTKMNRQQFLVNKVELKRPQIRYTEGLPILERKEEILSAILQNQIIIVAGETGSGKTTQLPVICLEAGRGRYGKIGCTQPRRIAAVSIANRIAEELHCQIGEEVGYKIRFNDKDSEYTSVKFMTDGILLAEIEQDQLLSRYDTLIIDEAHERSLNIDFILGYLRKLLNKRPDLKLIISSATIDTSLFSQAFGNAPVIEVSGRIYPVELLYLSDNDEETPEETYVDSAVKAAGDLLDLYNFGDMLIFMPTERDIRETCDRLKGLCRIDTVIMPLFARLGRAEQEAIFSKIDKRKIVVATNIAETSVTVPNIRFVIDTGLARISRYAPRLRTNRLPVEPISKAAADQRKGRCGRVMDGVCIRLYSEKQYNQREQYTLPEIKRANLAGVILSMIAHHLGDIEEFPFLEPPSRSAIAEGYSLLRELGAINENNRLTSLGKKMALLPIDPHIARMILAAKEESALREVLVIAAALSIVDPRERPFDKQAEADSMHKKFVVPGSDFLSFVKLWDAYQQEWDSLKTQNKMRKFCKEHFLSYTRMQEWHDVHQLLYETVVKMNGFYQNMKATASADAVHRSLLTGLLSNCARKSENGKFKATRGREIVIFPGSSLSGQKPEWIFCHEVVETSQLFARTVAPVNPLWLEQLGAHLCSRSYSEPYFDSETGVVRANEKISIFGMQIAEHTGICFGKIDSDRATSVFIRQGLVEEQLNGNYRFYTHNKSVRKQIEILEEKLRSRSLFAGEIAIEQFYSNRLSNIASVHDLNRFIKEKGGDDFLFMKSEDILVTDIPEAAAHFPDNVSIGDKKFPLKYSFEPGSDKDGVTLKVPVREVSFIPENSLGYLVPALWSAKILELLRNLPKEIRKKMVPVNEKAVELSNLITISAEPFEVNLSKAISALYGIDIDPAMLAESKLPAHLSLRIEVQNDNGKVITAGRGSDILKNASRNSDGANTSWDKAFKQYEKKGVTEWCIGSMPEHIEVVTSSGSMPLYGFPALKEGEDSVDYVLCRSTRDAQQIHLRGVKKLMELNLVQEFAWIERDLKFSQQLRLLCSPFNGADIVKKTLLSSIREYLLDIGLNAPRTKEQFENIINKVRFSAKSIGYEALTLLEKTLMLYNQNATLIKKEQQPRHSALKKELKNELNSYLNEITGELSYLRFRQFPRYMKAFGFRIQRAFLEPLKYERKHAELAVLIAKINQIADISRFTEIWYETEDYRAMVEEYAISLFAQQEVKTLYPVSMQRLDKKMAGISLLSEKKHC